MFRQILWNVDIGCGMPLDDSGNSRHSLVLVPPVKDKTNVIHVAFGSGGGRVAPKPEPEPEEQNVEPQLDLFSVREVEKLLGLQLQKLRSLDRANIVSPSGMRKGRRVYTFSDLIALRATRELLDQNVRLRDVARAIQALRKTLPKVTRPLQELRITSDGRKVIVRSQGAAFDPTGQLLFDFNVDRLERDVVRVLRPESQEARARTAYDLYLRANKLDETQEQYAEAIELYERAITLDPFLAIAYTNLGNLRFRLGDEAIAEMLYVRALEVDPKQSEARYNLGYLMLERGKHAAAIDHFQSALQVDPRFADAHFNLAMAYEAASDRERAKRHWRKYIELEPSGSWAEIARDHLK
jgi:tetratricopeptide (TPR) repeat protein